MFRVMPILCGCWVEAVQATGEADVGHVAGHRGFELSVTVPGDDRVDHALEGGLGAPNAVKSHSIACKTSVGSCR